MATSKTTTTKAILATNVFFFSRCVSFEFPEFATSHNFAVVGTKHFVCMQELAEPNESTHSTQA
jgi:hypothetical protein